MAEREFRLVVPKFDNGNHRIAVSVLAGIVQRVADHFGGATVYPATLGCFETAGEIQCEENIVVDVTRTDATPGQIQQDIDWMAGLAGDVARELGQEAVFEQQELDTRTLFAPGQRLASLPPDKLQRGPVPTSLFGRLIGR